MRRMRGAVESRSGGASMGVSDSTQTSAERMPARISLGSAPSCSATRQKALGSMRQPSGVAAAKTRMTKGRGASRPSCQAGMVESGAGSCATQSNGRSRKAARARARAASRAGPASIASRSGPRTGVAAGRSVSRSRWASTWRRPSGSPHHHVSGPASRNSSPVSARAMAGR